MNEQDEYDSGGFEQKDMQIDVENCDDDDSFKY